MTMASLLFVVFCNDFRATHRRRQNKLRLASLSHDLTSAMARRYYCQPTNESLPQKQHEHVNDGSVNICVTSLRHDRAHTRALCCFLSSLAVERCRGMACNSSADDTVARRCCTRGLSHASCVACHTHSHTSR